MKKSALEQKWQIFIGHAKKRGATEDELKILVEAMGLIKKYSPIRPINKGVKGKHVDIFLGDFSSTKEAKEVLN